MLGKIVKVTVDRPMGTYHPKHKDIYYPINYGYIEGIMAPDGEEQDAGPDVQDGRRPPHHQGGQVHPPHLHRRAAPVLEHSEG